MSTPGAADPTTGRRALIVLGGDTPPLGVTDVVPGHDLVIAADSGVDLALALGLSVDLAVGDFDSVTVDGLARIEGQGARIERHPAAKDATDFELALEAAQQMGASAATVIGGGGGRLDHLLANALVMASSRFEALDLVALDGPARLHVVRRRRCLHGEPGELVTLLAANGPATGITTSGLRYPLTDDRLEPGSSRGVSNQLIGSEAEVVVGSGVLLVVLPGPDHLVAPPVDHRPEGTET